MGRVTGRGGTTVEFDVLGSGPPLVLVHGVFTNRVSNWITVRDGLAARFTVYAVDRRGRGETSPSSASSTREEFEDVAAVIRSVDQPVFLLGHSYGAHVALGAASVLPERVRKLILYEPPTAASLSGPIEQSLQEDARRGDWDAFVARFFSEVAQLPSDELEAIRSSPIWGMLVDGAKPTLSDIEAFRNYDFDPKEFEALAIPVTFLCGSESPPIQFVATNALMETLPEARRLELKGQGHDGMYGDPLLFIETVSRVFAE
jgi:pimeloyl-ACP methyl ester carboxylesterase